MQFNKNHVTTALKQNRNIYITLKVSLWPFPINSPNPQYLSSTDLIPITID